MVNRAEELITQLEAEIVKRDARIVELEMAARFWLDDQESMRLELAVLKAQQPSGVRYFIALNIGGQNELHPISGPCKYASDDHLANTEIWSKLP